MRSKVASTLLGIAAALLVTSSALADGSGLPGDRGRPAGDGFPPLNPSPRPAAPPTPTPHVQIRSPGMDLALTAAQAIVEGCKGFPLTVSVANAAGEPILLYISDGAAAANGYISLRKAYTAATFKAPTSQLVSKAQQDADFAAQIKADPNLMAYPGGIVLKAGDEVIGAIGVSGHPGHREEECASIGVEKIKDQLLALVPAPPPVRGIATVPAEQQAVVQLGAGGPEVLQMQSVPVLSPAADQVLVRVFAAGVNPHDWKFRQQSPPKVLPRIVPGMDFAGVIETLGPGVTGLKVGEAVFGTSGEFNPDGSTLNGADAHFIVVAAANVEAKPSTLTYEQAAGLGLIAWIAGRAMDDARLRAGERVLITGAAGGVGSAAAQIAVARGAHVIGTASPKHFAYLKSLGVSEVVDYHDPNWIKRVGQVDMALETVGGPTAAMALNAVNKGGTFITTNPSSVTKEQYDAAAAAGVNCPEAGGPRPVPGPFLKEVAELVRARKFTVHVDRTYPLAEAA